MSFLGGRGQKNDHRTRGVGWGGGRMCEAKKRHQEKGGSSKYCHPIQGSVVEGGKKGARICEPTTIRERYGGEGRGRDRFLENNSVAGEKGGYMLPWHDGGKEGREKHGGEGESGWKGVIW